MHFLDEQKISVGARPSKLSQAQIHEVCINLKKFYPNILFDIHLIKTTGDLDKHSSLRFMDKTNFFTKEIDDWVLGEENRVGIHSAKDLPDPLPKNLSVYCYTQCINPYDSLVLRNNDTILDLPSGAIIATSSVRREDAVRQLRKDFTFCDIRGTIEERISFLTKGEVDGVVIAEAALIRLQLTHLNRIKLPGTTAEKQGQLAVVGQANNLQLNSLFSCLS